jgi:hypothetical protein
MGTSLVEPVKDGPFANPARISEIIETADSIFRPAGIQRRGVYVQAIELAAVNAPIWQIKNVCLFNHRYLNDNSLQFSTTDHFVSGGFVLVKTIPSLTFCWLPRSSFPESYASSKLN